MGRLALPNHPADLPLARRFVNNRVVAETRSLHREETSVTRVAQLRKIPAECSFEYLSLFF
jgi:hypothetical protein